MPKHPWNHRYSSFQQIGVGNQVHLRNVGDDEDVEPEFPDAKLLSEPSGAEGRMTADFYVPSLGRNVWGVTEVQYVAWTRYPRG